MNDALMIQHEADFDIAIDAACAARNSSAADRARESHDTAWRIYLATRPADAIEACQRLQRVLDEGCGRIGDAPGELAPLRPTIADLVADMSGGRPVPNAAFRIRNALAAAEVWSPGSDYTQILRGVAAWLQRPRLVA